MFTITNEQLNKIESLLKGINLSLDIQLFNDHMKLISDSIISSSDFVNKIEKLVAFSQAGWDCSATRSAYKLLRHLTDVSVLRCIADDDKYDRSLLSGYDRVVECLNAALMGSKKVCASLFNESCNPKANTYFISFAICSGDEAWVKELVESWDIDIKNPRYCFRIYAERLKSEELINYFESFDLNLRFTL